MLFPTGIVTVLMVRIVNFYLIHPTYITATIYSSREEQTIPFTITTHKTWELLTRFSSNDNTYLKGCCGSIITTGIDTI